MGSKSNLFACQCLKCGGYEKEMASALRLRNVCGCEKGPALVSCPCGWKGPAYARTVRSCYLVVDCPKCGAAVQKLTPEKRRLIERETGRLAHDNMALVDSLLRTKFQSCSRTLRAKLKDAGREAVTVAMIRWNPMMGKFSTYAMSHAYGRMRHAVRDYVKEDERQREYARHVRDTQLGYYEVEFTVDE